MGVVIVWVVFFGEFVIVGVDYFLVYWVFDVFVGVEVEDIVLVLFLVWGW